MDAASSDNARQSSNFNTTKEISLQEATTTVRGTAAAQQL